MFNGQAWKNIHGDYTARASFHPGITRAPIVALAFGDDAEEAMQKANAKLDQLMLRAGWNPNGTRIAGR